MNIEKFSYSKPGLVNLSTRNTLAADCNAGGAAYAVCGLGIGADNDTCNAGYVPGSGIACWITGNSAPGGACQEVGGGGSLDLCAEGNGP